MMNRRQFLVSTGAVLTISAAEAGPVPRDLPFRQIHLDFHTGEQIPDVGAEFDAREFVSVL
jgi:hypothetical protein